MFNTLRDGQGSHFQRSKFLICYCLDKLHVSKEANAKQLEDDICCLSIGSIRACLSRMANGYKGPNRPRYLRHYVRKMRYPRTPAVYKLLAKCQHFLVKLQQTRPHDTNTWLNELIQEREMREVVHDYLRTHYKKRNSSQ